MVTTIIMLLQGEQIIRAKKLELNEEVFHAINVIMRIHHPWLVVDVEVAL